MFQRKRRASQIWLGTFSSAEQFYGFIRERDDYFEKREQVDRYALSDFIETQGQVWFDHDFCEGQYSEKTLNSSLDLKISFSNLYGQEIDRRMNLVGLTTFNAGLSMGLFDPESKNEGPEVDNPVSVEGRGFIFHYMGIVEFDC